jgi:hypothetical protein
MVSHDFVAATGKNNIEYRTPNIETTNGRTASSEAAGAKRQYRSKEIENPAKQAVL